MKNNVVCYTYISDDYNELKDHTHMVKDWDYVCFTNNKNLIKLGRVGNWQIRKSQFEKLDAKRNSGWHKTHPHVLFPEYEKSVWIDSNIDVLTDFLEKTLANTTKKLFVPIHYERNCIYDEIDEVKKTGHDTPEKCDATYSFLRAEKMPEKYGLNETNIMLREHNDDLLKSIDEMWWDCIKNYSKRDQLSFSYCLFKHDIKVKDIAFANARIDETNYRLVGHKYPQKRSWVSKMFRKERFPSGRRHIYLFGIKIISYTKKHKRSNGGNCDAIYDYRKIFAKSGYQVARKNNKIQIWNDVITIEGEADNTLWTAVAVFCEDEYHFDMNEEYVMFDIGFNLGMTSLHKAQDKNCVKIYAFEPFVPTFELAQRNMDLNKELSKKITAFNYGLGDKDEIIEINYNPSRPGAMSSVKNVFKDSAYVEKIRIRKTSDVLAPLFEKCKEKIFLKIDCEGAEKQILPELENSGLIKRVDVIIMEWHFEEPSWIVDLLIRNGFVVFRLNTIANELGMIRAYRK